jgi:hypothetical protein
VTRRAEKIARLLNFLWIDNEIVGGFVAGLYLGLAILAAFYLLR